MSVGPFIETIRDYEYVAYLGEYAHDAYINNEGKQMTNQLTAQQINWAKQHDWFTRMQDGLIVVTDRWVNMNTGDRGEDEIVWDKSFRALRDWAGY